MCVCVSLCVSVYVRATQCWKKSSSFLPSLARISNVHMFFSFSFIIHQTKTSIYQIHSFDCASQSGRISHRQLHQQREREGEQEEVSKAMKEGERGGL